jgi:phosphonopyruvate decarboxylase
MNVETFTEILGADFYTGVPDSLLRPLCDFLMKNFRDRNIIATNEGNCAAIAAGYHLATGKIPVVYMQNSGEGNIINPLASLLNEKIYSIPIIFVVGWRGEPGVHDEPQHIFQGEITCELLNLMGVKNFVIDKETSPAELQSVMEDYKKILASGSCVAFVIKKGALTFDEKISYKNSFIMRREDVLKKIIDVAGKDFIIATTGKTGRELFELREEHSHDFLTVGSMGHCSSIALGLALNRPEKNFWCVDGDGALLMHMGAVAVIGAAKPENLIHVVINNGAHESVGGMPTAAASVDLTAIARACGYQEVFKATDFDELETFLQRAKSARKLTFLEVECAIGSRKDLGRPTTTPAENKLKFMGAINDSQI